MKGYFVSISKDAKTAFVYHLDYDINPSEMSYQTSGTWSPTKLELSEEHVVLKSTPGYHLRIQKLQNTYFEKFCQSTDVNCDGWMQGKTKSPYKVTRFKGDRMFLVLAMDLSTKAINVTADHLKRALERSGVSSDSRVIYS